ncbi:MAG: hypothetical protein K9N09_08020 [Candidatus Cloacimonetes bacterium]|nr:hypothetical protein [Candidatus Cloacimonadota bacterium]MCF7814002.1 hypothetical protein [Candidatus Cloacimonadota bacterium]MCF7868630.1 hypothetical protein [Candidatus Cloacimonadota bacterium]MCF7882859.1 hypothetical protein [Candidatus Cloacimonadota bacterium]
MASKDRGKIRNIQYFKTQQEWKAWLEKHSTISHVVWLQFYRPHTEKPVMEMKETLETAKEFNWKHTLIKRIDDDSYARKFVPITETAVKPEDSSEIEEEKDEDTISPALPLVDDDVFTTKDPDAENPDDQEETVVEIPEEEEIREIEEDKENDEDEHFIAPLNDLFEDKEEHIEDPDKIEEDKIMDDEVFFPEEEKGEEINLEHDLDEEDELILTDISEEKEEEFEQIDEEEPEDLITPEDEVFEDEVFEDEVFEDETEDDEPQTDLEIADKQSDKPEQEKQAETNESEQKESDKAEEDEEEDEKEFVRKVTPTLRKK